LPIYEYQCLECGKKFETMQKITEEPLDSCPFCSGEGKKLVSHCSFRLKGSGWYLTDYAKKSEKKKEEKKEKKDKKTDSPETKTKQKEMKNENAVNQ